MDEHKKYGAWDDKFAIFGEYPVKIKDSAVIPQIVCGHMSIKSWGFPNKERKLDSRYARKENKILLSGWLILTLSFLYYRKRSNPSSSSVP
jgi:hypothetical protein